VRILQLILELAIRERRIDIDCHGRCPLARYRTRRAIINELIHLSDRVMAKFA
jgi:hypothetical protein